jgi:acyl dehydratase
MASNNELYYEDVEVGGGPEKLAKGPLTTTHLMRWSAAMENWHKIHYDKAFAIEHDKLPDLLVNGSLKQQFISQLLKDWVGRTGWVWKTSYQFRAMNKVNETLYAWAKVTAKRDGPGYGLVDLDVGIVNDKGVESTPGKATVALPYRNGKPLPYPFVPPKPQAS